jgi:hypothetical protein
VRKVSGYTRPPQANEEVFEQAVLDIAEITTLLLDTLVATGQPKNREQEAEKKRARWQRREERIRSR